MITVVPGNNVSGGWARTESIVHKVGWEHAEDVTQEAAASG
jgi:hypothetical protein